MTENWIYELYLRCGSKVTTSSKEVPAGSLFIGIKGERFDGSDFAADALKAGASAALVNRNSKWDGVEGIYQVDDTYAALVLLAKTHRRSTGVKILGITGTNGKTTTKELTAACLAKHFKAVEWTKGNLNNNIGVPLTLLTVKPETEVLVLEMGASHIGDIDELCRIADPDMGLITNCGRAHIEGFGSEEGIRKTKGELFHHVAEHSGCKVLFVNRDDANICKTVSELDSSVEIHGYSAAEASIIPGEYLAFTYKGLTFHTHLSGQYNVYNALAALTVGEYFGASLAELKEAIEEYVPSNKRSQIVPSEAGNIIILDAYNANPSSMEVSIKNALSIAQAKGLEAVFCIGNMLELGAASKAEHQAIIGLTEGHKAYFVGSEFKGIAPCEQYFETSEDLAAALPLLHDCVILIKGSRGSAMEKILPAVK